MSQLLITGATGQLGSQIVSELTAKYPIAQLSVLARSSEKGLPFTEKGITVKIGNYQDPSSLLEAMQGIDRVLLISSSDFNDRIGQHKNVIDAAKAAGVQHIFYTGVAIKDIETSPLKPLLGDHFETEEYIKQSGLTYTFLRNSLYADVVPMFIGANTIETGVFFPAGEGKVAFANRKDLAKAIAKIVAKSEHENKIFNLTGSQSHSFSEIASYLSELSGKEVPYISPSSADFENALKGFGLPEPIITMSVLFAAGIKNNDFEEVDSSLKTIIDQEPTSLKAFLKEAYQL
ncbi:SDR family NAD(P)-dependent oxidoreductase [Flavobacterium sp. 9R]|uniref:SDR family oxidoreductase n=1 Tax=Flavobacterium sp. 9R TaxID=2653143 RepID=UPI0012F28A20|nr:SDR family oxidoreductase [Flavobacterium sp. 9R]VXB61434.1 SDR family NAD(P)-dependent oxidoreductase [Flavobacterium sp. 9R]